MPLVWGRCPVAECKRHRWTLIEAFPIQKKGPTGHPSGWWGMWERRACECGAKDGRYAPGINGHNVADAYAAYRERADGVAIPKETNR